MLDKEPSRTLQPIIDLVRRLREGPFVGRTISRAAHDNRTHRARDYEEND